MNAMHVRTEPLAGSTLAATIRYEEPGLRPYRPLAVRFDRSMTSADDSVKGLAANFRLIFLEGSVWDVARIAARLKLRNAHDPTLACVTCMSGFDGTVTLRETPLVADADYRTLATWAHLSIDDAGRPRRDAFELVTR